LTTQTEDPDVTKLLSMTDNVVVRDRVYGSARKTGAENVEYGRLHKCITELAKAAQALRKSIGKSNLKEDE
jgi:hypothetical protein